MEDLKVYELSDDVRAYRPLIENEEQYSQEQIEFIDGALEKFNELAIYRKNANEKTKKSFISNLLDPNFKVEKMRIILDAIIEMFNYVSATEDDLSKRDVAHLCKLSKAIGDAVSDPTYNIVNEEEKVKEEKEPVFDPSKYIHKGPILLCDDDDDDWL